MSLPASATHVEARGPGGEPFEVSQRGGLSVIPATPRAGFYRVTWQGPHPGTTLLPVNLASAAESDLSPRPLPAQEGKVSVASAAEPDAHDEHSWILALAALFFVVFDVWYLTRAPRPVSLGGPARLPERGRA